MCNKGFIKRVLPFGAAFLIGIFIASFFVSVSSPNFRGRGFGKRHAEMKRLRIENETLKNENLRLKNEIESRTWTRQDAPRFDHDEEMKGIGPEFPVAETAPRHSHRKRIR